MFMHLHEPFSNAQVWCELQMLMILTKKKQAPFETTYHLLKPYLKNTHLYPLN